MPFLYNMYDKGTMCTVFVGDFGDFLSVMFLFA